MQRFRISATGHSLNYLPEYVAVRQGFFAEEGLDIAATVPSPWDLVLDELGSGEAQAVLGGIWVPSMFHGRGRRYRPFAQVSARAPLAVVGRGSGALDWTATAGRIFAMKGSNGASVGLFIKMLLREHGMDPAQIGFIQDLDGKMLSALFAGGMADYLVIDAPSALAMEAAGQGRVQSILAVDGGDVPWSVYYAIGEADEAQRATETRFARAIGRGMDWLLQREPEAYRDLLQSTFPRFDPALLVRLVGLYRKAGMWTTPRIDPAGFARWQRGIADGHLVPAPLAYDALIDSGPTAALEKT